MVRYGVFPYILESLTVLTQHQHLEAESKLKCEIILSVTEIDFLKKTGWCSFRGSKVWGFTILLVIDRLKLSLCAVSSLSLCSQHEV